jgi:hypothetical protein
MRRQSSRAPVRLRLCLPSLRRMLLLHPPLPLPLVLLCPLFPFMRPVPQRLLPLQHDASEDNR